MIWIKIAETFILGALYLPYEGSIYYKRGVFEDLTMDICSIKSQYDLPLLLIGDFNSRTGLLNEIWMLETHDDLLDLSYFNYPDIINIFNSLNIPIKRANKDKKTNNNGHKLIEMCMIHDLCILNGRLGTDRNIGDVTCADASTIDYMICTPDLLHRVTHCAIDKFDPEMSDKHCPIELTVNTSVNLTQEASTRIEDEHATKKTTTKCKWDDRKKEDYKMSFDEAKITGMFNTLFNINTSTVTQESMEMIATDLKEAFLVPAEATGMLTQQITGKKSVPKSSNKPWFNNVCNESKNNYNKFKKTLSKPLKDDEKEALKSLSKKHRKTLRKEKRKFEEELNAKIRDLRSNDSGKYWNLIKPKKKVRMGNISIDSAFRHLMT